MRVDHDLDAFSARCHHDTLTICHRDDAGRAIDFCALHRDATGNRFCPFGCAKFECRGIVADSCRCGACRQDDAQRGNHD